jgi:hypothetical protein
VPSPATESTRPAAGSSIRPVDRILAPAVQPANHVRHTPLSRPPRASKRS